MTGLCEYVRKGDKIRCRHCGHVRRTTQADLTRVRRPCPKMPGPARLAVNYLRDTARHLATGAKQASPEEQERRLAICRGCEFFRVVKGHLRCKHTGCGCFLRQKAARLSSTCPVGRWEA